MAIKITKHIVAIGIVVLLAFIVVVFAAYQGFFSALTNRAGAVDATKFDAVNRACLTIIAKSDAGITIEQASQSLQDIALELKITRPKMTSAAENEILVKYERAYEILKDSVFLWNHAIKNKEFFRSLVNKGNRPAIREWPRWQQGEQSVFIPSDEYKIVTKYSLDGKPAEDTKVFWISPGAVKQLWKLADLEVAHANQLMKGRE